MEADDATLKSRITKRQHDASEADLGVLNLLQANHEPLSPQERGHAVVFDATSEDKFSGTAWGRLLKLAEQAPILLK
jgi:predicted kinase